MRERSERRLRSFEYYFETKRAALGNGFGLILSSCAPRQIHPPHVHANPGIMVALSGDYLEETRTGTYVQRPLVVRYRPSWESHSHRVGPSGSLGLHIEFNPEWLARYGLEERDLGSYRFANDVATRIRTLRLLLLGFGPNGTLADEASDMAIELIECLIDPKPAGAPKSPTWLLEAVDLVRHRFRERLSLSHVAYEVGISPMHLARTFRCSLGLSVTEYIRDQRLAETTRLILEEDLSIGEASVMAGFYDHAHFSRCFSARCGGAPISVKQMKSLMEATNR